MEIALWKFSIMRSVVLFNISAWLVLLLVFTTVELPGETQFWASLQNSGHGLAMCLAAFLSISTLAWKSPLLTLKIYIIVPVALIVLSILIEAVQHFIGRSASISDIVLDTAGILAGMCFSAVVCVNARGLIKLTYFGLGMLILVFCIRMPVYYFLADRFAPTLPVLADFDNIAARATIQGDRTALTIGDHTNIWPLSTAKSIRVVYSPGRWPFVRIASPAKDWSNYGYLVVDVFNSQNEAVQLNIRVDYQSISPSDRSFVIGRRIVQPGHSTVDVSYTEFSRERYGSEPNFTQIEGVMLYLSDPKKTQTLYFDNIKLSK